jgi:DNA-binding NarL/FixJ family response regulator
MIRILLADDHAILRQGLRNMIEEEAGFEVVGEAADGFEAIQKARDLKPDILVVDLAMPHLNGLEVTNRVKQEKDAPRVIVLSMRKSEPYIMEALRNGADGYVLKSEDPKDMLNAIHAVAAGSTYLSPAVADLAVEAYLQFSRQVRPDPYAELTDREKEIFQLSAEGMSSEEIAEFLTLSVHTISTHRRYLMGKLNIKNQAELITYAVRRGIIGTDF